MGQFHGGNFMGRDTIKLQMLPLYEAYEQCVMIITSDFVERKAKKLQNRY